MQGIFIVCAVLSSLLCSYTNAQDTDPLCQNKVPACQPTEVCRVVEACSTPNSCSHEAICLPQTESNYLSGGCIVGEPILETNATGQLELRVCYTKKNCADGFYCSAELQDVSSRCCRAAPVSTKAGACSQPETIDRFFCVDQCRSDADCHWDQKCCTDSTSCARKNCQMPDPCSLKACPSGQECIVNPSYNAECVASKPPPPPLPLDPSGSTATGSGSSSGAPGVADEPLCQNPTRPCAQSEDCRVLETCNFFGSCSQEQICVPKAQSSLLSGGCIGFGEPLLQRNASGGYELRSCYTQNNCNDGFYCSTALQDVSSRCCRAKPQSIKTGTCPALTAERTYFCVDECRSDEDCLYDMKCCPNSNTCSRMTCKMPEPCSVKNCASGEECVTDPDGRTASCVAVAPPLDPVTPNQGQPPTLGFDTPAWGFFPWNGFQQLNRLTCPYPGFPYGNDCSINNMCGYRGARRCPRGTVCCATTYCGNICRTPIRF